MTDKEKLIKTIELIMQYGGIEGDHHKVWILDQSLRILMGSEEYQTFRESLEKNDYWYDEGIPP